MDEGAQLVGDAATSTISLDADSEIVFNSPDMITSDYPNALAGLLGDFVPDHIAVTATGTGVAFSELYPDGSTDGTTPVTEVVLKSAFEKMGTGSLAGATPTYTGAAQPIFTGAAPAGGTAYYSINNGTEWDIDVPEQTAIGTVNTGAYIVRGDSRHDNSEAVTNLTVGIVKAGAITVTALLNQEIVLGDAVPALGNVRDTDYTIEGLVNDPADIQAPYTFEAVLAYFDKNGNEIAAPTAAGTYTVGFSTLNFVNDNYEGVNEVTGQLKITDGTANWNAGQEPSLVTEDIVYDGNPHTIVNPGTSDTGTPVYSTEGATGPWEEGPLQRTDSGEYHVWWKIEGDDTHADSAVTEAAGTVIIDPAGDITITAQNRTITKGSAVNTDSLYRIVGGSLKGTDQLEVAFAWPGGEPDGNTEGDFAFEIQEVHIKAPGSDDNYGARLIEEANGTLTVTAGGGGGGGGGGEEVIEDSPSYDFKKQDEGIGSFTADNEHWTWGERAELSKDLADFYKILSENSVPAIYSPVVVNDVITISDPTGNLSSYEDNYSRLPGGGSGHEITSFLASDDAWVLPAEDPNFGPYEVAEVLVCQDNEPIYTANGDGKVDQSTFGNSNFFAVGVGTGDMKVDYPNLKTGDVVTNTSFNGVFVTKLQKSNNPTFDADLAKLKSDTIASFRAFELDHPEVFWLNGSIKLRVLTVTISGVQTSFIFMTLVDDKGFTMRIADYAAAGAIENGIKQRDAAVAAIIAQIPAGASTREKVVNLNKWFTMNNEYNRSADLSAIGYTPHRSLKSLTGNFGINGPVCDGYSRGFKTVCDRLGIPVILDTGVASIGSHSELHMWMRIQVDGTWYGTDCTWDDPIVKGKDGKVSGYENEKYLLVGKDTVVDGKAFGVSHPVNETAGGTTGVLFANLILNTDEISGYLPLDFEDVRLADWFYDYVKSAVDLGLMAGTSEGVFNPTKTATRGQIVQILYNAAGTPAVDEIKVEGWYGAAATWAMNEGIVAGYADGEFHGDDPITREQLATILWSREGAPAQEGTLDFADADKVSSYAVDALIWAKANNIFAGKPGNIVDPQGKATRAEIATIFSKYMQ